MALSFGNVMAPHQLMKVFNCDIFPVQASTHSKLAKKYLIPPFNHSHLSSLSSHLSPIQMLSSFHDWSEEMMFTSQSLVARSGMVTRSPPFWLYRKQIRNHSLYWLHYTTNSNQIGGVSNTYGPAWTETINRTCALKRHATCRKVFM